MMTFKIQEQRVCTILITNIVKYFIDKIET